MEDSSTPDDALERYERLRWQRYENAGAVIQWNPRRSEADVIKFAKLRPNGSLCKGAHVEPPPIALQGKEEIQPSFIKRKEMLFAAKCFAGLATHDESMIRKADDSIPTRVLSKDPYEFQTLHGAKPRLGDPIVADGHRLRTYIPFGGGWHASSMPRFSGNPQLVLHVLMALLSGNA